MANQNRAHEVQNQQHGANEAGPATYQGFLVRMWKEGTATLWRSSAQSVQTGEIVRFASLTELFAFLEAQTVGLPEDEGTAGWRTPPTRK